MHITLKKDHVRHAFDFLQPRPRSKYRSSGIYLKMTYLFTSPNTAIFDWIGSKESLVLCSSCIWVGGMKARLRVIRILDTVS